MRNTQGAERVPEPKDKLGVNLISKEEYDMLSARFRKSDGSEMQPEEPPQKPQGKSNLH